MFDRVVRANAADAEQADRIVQNRFFRNMVGALSGTQEYMASEALHQLHGDERFDVVVVDTPPSRHALDFLEAPGVLGQVPRTQGVQAADAADAWRPAGAEHRRPAAPAGDRAGRRVRCARRRGCLLPGLRRDGGRVSRPGVVGHEPPDLTADALRAGGRAEAGHRRRGGVVRRAAPGARDRSGGGGRQPGSPAVRIGIGGRGGGAGGGGGRSGRSPPCGRTSPSCARSPNASATRSPRSTTASTVRRLVEVPLLAGDVHDLDGLVEIGRHLFKRRSVPAPGRR